LPHRIARSRLGDTAGVAHFDQNLQSVQRKPAFGEEVFKHDYKVRYPMRTPRGNENQTKVSWRRNQMAHVRKDTLTAPPEWWKHFRPWNKRCASKRERQAARKLIRRAIYES